jgi:hypothetical protein
MSESLSQTKNKSQRLVKRGAGFIGGGLAISLALSACANPIETTSQTASKSISPCASREFTPSASDGVVALDKAKLVRTATNEAQTILHRVMNNGGIITLDYNMGTSANLKRDQLQIKVNDGNPALITGYEADIPIKLGKPVIGMGSLACNGRQGTLYQTNFDHSIGYFYDHTASFSSSVSN